ncbi:MAG: type II toxin-antitoxin system Phd/YefM family antitoxin [Fimbriimonadaceae bacterium]
MKSMSVTQFKARFLELVEQIRRTGQAVRLTKRGEPIVYVGPLQGTEGIDLTPGRCANTVKTVGDVMTPIEDTDDAEVEKRWF